MRRQVSRCLAAAGALVVAGAAVVAVPAVGQGVSVRAFKVHAVDLRSTAQLTGVLRAAVTWRLYFGASTAVPGGGSADADMCAAAAHAAPGLGPVSELPVVPGQLVTKGQVLARADTAAVHQALDSAQQDLAQAQALLEQHRSAAADTAAATGSAAGSPTGAAADPAATAQSLLGPDLDRVAREQQRVTALQRTVDDATITAPADGVVDQLGTALGASPDCRAPALVLRSRDLEVHTQVDGGVRDRLRPGLPVDVVVPDSAAQVATRVVALPLSATTAAPGSGSAPEPPPVPTLTGQWTPGPVAYPLDLALPAPPVGALPGMPATVTITLEARPGVLAVPESAVHSDGAGAHVTLLHCPFAGRAGRCGRARAAVETGITVDQLTQITAGVQAGDTVAVP